MGRLAPGDELTNHSKLLKLQLGQQLPIKSPFEMKRDIVKRALNGFPSAAFNPINPGLLALELTLGRGFHSPSITPLSLKLDCSNFAQNYFRIG